MTAADTTLVTHRGGCHCHRVVFEVDAPSALVVQDCNCSLCRMSGFLHLIVPQARFLDEGNVTGLAIEPFDGRNWEQNADSLAHLSQA